MPPCLNPQNNSFQPQALRHEIEALQAYTPGKSKHNDLHYITASRLHYKIPSMAPLASQRSIHPSTPPPLLSLPLPRALIHSLSTITQTSRTRTLLIILFCSPQNYCPTCSPHLICFPCSKTCPLLRPYTFAPRAIDPDWLNNVMRDNALLRALLTDIQKSGQNASKERVKVWTAAAEKLRISGQSELEKIFEKGWMVVDMRRAVGMDLGWVFEGNWRGRGQEEEEMEGPGEGGNRKGLKRRRGMGHESEESGGKRLKVEEVKDRVVRRSKRITKMRDNLGAATATKKRGRNIDEDEAENKHVRQA
jgi:hypothetical protein